MLMMLAIFLFSSGPSLEMTVSQLERVVNKAGHMVGYGMLALFYWRIFGFMGNRRWLAWVLAILYAMSDEFHQTFVPGRYGNLFDVLVYDNLGALISLWLANLYLKQKQPALQDLVVEEEILTTHR